MSERTSTTTTTDGVELVVSERGSGATLLLIPGLGAGRRVFDPLIAELESRYRTVSYDPRGIGDSDPGDLPLTMPLLAADAAAVIWSTGEARTHVFGASMGGAVAQQLAVDHPQRIERLVLAATAPPGPRAVPADPRVTAALLGKGARTPADAYRVACTVLYSVHFQRTHSEFIDEQVRVRAEHPVAARTFRAQLEALRAPSDVWERLAHLQTPVLIAHGSADSVIPMENARLLAGRIKGARTRWFDGCGHLFFHERPQESARVVHEFLGG